MGLKQVQVDNVDKLPQGAPHPDSAPWTQPRTLLDWRVTGILCLFALFVLLIGYMLFGRDIKAWIQYGDGYGIIKGGFALVFLAGLASIVRRAILIEQRGYKVFIWNANAPKVIEQLIKVDREYAARMFPNAAQLTLQSAPPQQIEEDDEDIIEGELLLPAPPALIPDHDWMMWIDQTPHLMIAGRTNAGKTTMAEAVLAQRIQAGDELLICDPHYQPGKWHGVQAIGGGNDFESILSMLPKVIDDMDARYKEFNAGKQTEDFQRLTILIDEVPALVGATFTRTASGSKKITDTRWLDFAKRLGSQARKVRISVILLTQSILVDDLLINSADRENFIRVGLGDKARPLLSEADSKKRDALYQLLNGQSYPAAIEHAGDFHLLDTSRVPALASRHVGHLAQVWQVAAALPVMPPVQRPPVAHQQASQTVTTSIPAPGAIIYPATVKSQNGKIAFLLRSGYTYRQIERELSVSHQTISMVNRALRAKDNAANQPPTA